MPAGAASLVFVGLPVSAGLGGLINLTLAVRKDNPLRFSAFDYVSLVRISFQLGGKLA